VKGWRATAICGLLLASAAPVAEGSLPADIQPLHYQLTVTPDVGTSTFSGDLTIDLRVVNPTTRITLDAVELAIIDSTLTVPNGRAVHPAVSVDAAAGTVTFTLPSHLLPGTARLHIEYDGRLRIDGRGFYVVRTQGRKYVLSQMESVDARRAFPCVDEPAAKASFALSAVIDEGLTAISNGPVVSDTPGPKFGKHTVRFGTTPKMSSYLVALAVGDFQCVEGSAESIPVRVCTLPERKGLARFALEAAEQAFTFDSRYFGFHYPFRKLDLVAVPGNFPGAMENAGAIFFDEGLLSDGARASESALANEASVLSHEIAHLWLGDIVTMASWDDLWLNEGFATWMTPKAIAAWRPQWHAELGEVASAGSVMRLDALKSTRAVRAPVSTAAEIDESFDQVAYDKGAAIVRMVEAWLGPDTFRKALSAFVHAHAFGAVTTEDLGSALQAESGQPVAALLAGFITRPGVPEVSIESGCDGGDTVVTASVRRFSPGAPPAAPEGASWTIPIGLRGVGEGASRPAVSTVVLAAPRQTFRLAGCFAAVFANAGANGYYYTSYTADAMHRLASAAESQLTPAERIRLLEDAWDLARAGHQHVGDYLMVAAAMAADATPDVVEELDHELTFVRDYLVPGPERALFESWVTRVFSPVQQGLGWKAAQDESEDRARQRRAVLDILGRAGRDQDVLATSRAMIDAHLAGRERIEPAFMPIVVRLASVTAGADLLSRLRALDEREVLTTTSDAAFVLGVLTHGIPATGGRDPWPEWLSAALGNPAAQSGAWKVVSSRWNDVRQGFAEPAALSALEVGAGQLCDGDSQESVRQLFAGKADAAPRTLRLTLDRIDSCRDVLIRLDAPLADWLKSAPARTPQGIR
jgi:aminopeptidase N